MVWSGKRIEYRRERLECSQQFTGNGTLRPGIKQIASSEAYSGRRVMRI